MKLFLASIAKNPISIKKLEECVHGFKNKTIAYIPTAANGEDGWGSWKNGESWNLVNKLEANITLVQLEDYKIKDPAEDLIGKDIIWFAGGYTGYLLYWIRLKQLNNKIKGILEKGSIYVGSSAGSMITGKDMSFAEWYVGEKEPGVSCFPGLGLVDFNFYPHYEEKDLEEIKKRFNKNGKEDVYLVKDGEVIIVEDEKIYLSGEKRLLTKKVLT